MTDPLRAALEIIASASPTLTTDRTGERRCAMCRALIDEARDALGYERWPAMAKTVKGACADGGVIPDET